MSQCVLVVCISKGSENFCVPFCALLSESRAPLAVDQVRDESWADFLFAFGTALGTSMVLRPLVDTLEAFVVLVRTAERGASR